MGNLLDVPAFCKMCAAARIGADEVFTAAYHCDVAGAGLLSAAKIFDIVNMPINCCPIVQGEPLCFAVTFREAAITRLRRKKMNRRRESWFFIKMLLSKQDWIDSVFSFVCSPFVTMKIVDFGHLI